MKIKMKHLEQKVMQSNKVLIKLPGFNPKIDLYSIEEHPEGLIIHWFQNLTKVSSKTVFHNTDEIKIEETEQDS